MFSRFASSRFVSRAASVASRAMAASRGKITNAATQAVRNGYARTASQTSSASSSSMSRAVLVATGLTGATMALFNNNSNAPVAESKKAEIPLGGVAGTKNERAFVAIKPDGVERGLVGEIIKRFESKGFKLVAIKVLRPTLSQAEGHYSDLSTKPFFPSLTQYFSSGPIVAMVWEGSNVISTGRQMLGATNPQMSAPGTIRGDFAIETGRNIIHCSDKPESAKQEIEFWFKQGEVCDWVPTLNKWVYEK